MIRARLLQEWQKLFGGRANQGYEQQFVLASAGVIGTMIAAVSVVIYQLGGTHLAYVHIGYIPVLFAAAVFAVPGGVLAGVILGLALGPAMPLDVDAGIAQPWESWVTRLIFFVVIGAVVGGIVMAYQAAARRERNLAKLDPRTRLPNRMAFIDDLVRYLEAGSGCCVLLEIDDYDDILVTLGPEAAEDLTWKVSARLTDALPEGVALYHMHSARFGIWLAGKNADEAVELGKQLLDRLNAPIAAEALEIQVGGTFGVVPATDKNVDLLLRQAAATLGQARLRQRHYGIHESTDVGLRGEAFALVSDLRTALATQTGLSLHYQPKIDLDNGRCCGAECLLRWTHPTKGSISPAFFIPLVERTTLMRSLSRWVVETAVARLARGDLKNGFVLAINVSARDIEDPEFSEFLAATLDSHGVQGRQIELELTETAFIRDLDEVAAGMEKLQALGVSIAIDDFGSAHASFSYLKHLPINTVKIDRDFITGLPNPLDEAIIRATITFAQSMNFAVVAEGVERLDVGETLRSLGCQFAQGYAYSPPVSESEFIAFL